MDSESDKREAKFNNHQTHWQDSKKSIMTEAGMNEAQVLGVTFTGAVTEAFMIIKANLCGWKGKLCSWLQRLTRVQCPLCSHLKS